MKKVMSYADFRKDFQVFFSGHPGVIWKKHELVVNEAFPGTFNLSFNETEHLEKFGSYIDYSELLIFGKIQPVIRHNDFMQKILLDDDGYKYLGLFDMGGLSLSMPTNDSFEAKVSSMIEYAWGYLIERLRLDPEKLYVKYSMGGNISKITGGKYNFDKNISPDELAQKYWSGLGLQAKNMIGDSSRDTFLALHSFGRVSPWGYRNEILYDIGKGNTEKGLLDIATLEYFPWKPVLSGDKIVDIEINDSFCTIIVFGLDRLHFLKERYAHIVQSDHIYPLYQSLNISGNPIDNETFALTESIRVIQRVFTDARGYSSLGQSRKKKLSKYIQVIEDGYKKRKMNIKDLRKLFTLNANLNSYYPEFKINLDLVINQTQEAIERREGTNK